MKRYTCKLCLFTYLFLYCTFGVAVELNDSIINKLNIPCIVISTLNEKEPTGYWAYAPEGYSGKTLTGNEYVCGRMTFNLKDSVLYDSGEYLAGESGIRIKLRGNSSAQWGKKPYKIKLAKKTDLFFRDDKIYKAKDWVLLNCPKIDLNTAVGFKVSELLGMEWTPKSQFVNLIINNDYKGLYILVESVEKDKGRLNIPDDGFIIEDDAYWWNEEVYFKGEVLPDYMGYTLKYPDTDDVNEETINDIKNYILDFERKLISNEDVSEYVDFKSFAKWLLVHDILGTEDARGANRYLYTNSLSVDSLSLLKMGPVWDFDDIFKRKDMWSQQHSGNYRFYYSQLLEYETFNKQFVDQWYCVKDYLYADLMSFLSEMCSTYGEDLEYSRDLDSKRWNRSEYNTLEEEINIVDTWMQQRIAWIDKQLFVNTSIESVSLDSNAEGMIFMLDGRKMDLGKKLPSGLYIINGKKHYVR